MLGKKIPVFEKGTVLSHEMLENLKDISMDYIRTNYQNYANGIISGFDIKAVNDTIIVGKGMFVFNQEVFVISNETNVTIRPTGQWQILAIKVSESYREKNFVATDIEIEVSASTDNGDDIIEICRFKLQDGASLRINYRDFYDMNTEFDTVNIIHSKWSAYNGDSVSKSILEKFADGMLKQNSSNPLDIDFVSKVLALDGKTMNRKAISYYISMRLERTYSELDNFEIYKALCEILRNSKSGGRREPAFREHRRIIVD